MEGCLTYSYMSGFDGFNPNFLMFVFLPVITYYLYKCIDENKLYYWVILGICTGLAFLSKYQFVLLFLSLLIYLLIFKRRVFKEKGIYIVFVLSLVIFLPHLMWLFNHDFFSFLYFSNCEKNYLTAYQGWTKYIQAPFMFLPKDFEDYARVKMMAGEADDLRCPICGSELNVRVVKRYDLEDNLILHYKASCKKCPFQIV